MSFFGITAYCGDPLKTNLLKALNVSNFSDEEFLAAFDVEDTQGSGYLESHEIRFVFTRTYGTEPSEKEVECFLSLCPRHEQVTKERFVEVLNQVREKTKTDAGSATEYQSKNTFDDDRHKHSRSQFGPKDKFREGVLESQKYGWQASTDIEKDIDRRPNNQCAETKYAAEMVKSGMHY